MSKLGYKHTEEAKANMSKAKKGKIVTEETKAKLSRAMVGRKGYWLGKHRSEDTKNKLRIARTGTTLSEEHKSKISQTLEGNKRALGHRHSEKTKEIISQTHSGIPKTEIHKDKMRQRCIGNEYSLGCQRSQETKVEMSRIQKLRWQDPKQRAKLSRDAKLRWQNPEYKDRVLRASMLGRFIHPNKPESVILDMLEATDPGEWEFVGDGEIIIAGKNPDFFNCNGKKAVILLHGIYWHLWKEQKNNPNLTKGQVEVRDIEHYRKFGYTTLIIWEDELNEQEKVIKRITEFVEG